MANHEISSKKTANLQAILFFKCLKSVVLHSKQCRKRHAFNGIWNLKHFIFRISSHSKG